MTAMRAPDAEEAARESSVVSRHLVAIDGAAEARFTRPRLSPARWFFFTDLVFGLVAYALALMLHSEASAIDETAPLNPSWTMLVPLVITFCIFYALGLYERELLALSALHLLTLAKGMLWSAAVSALVVYLLHLPVGFDSRLTAVGTFALFFVFAAVVRTFVLPRVLRSRFREDMGKTLVVGWPYRTEPLRERLTMLKGFSRVVLVDGGRETQLVAAVTQRLRESTADGRPAFGSLFIDVGSLEIAETLELIAAGHRYGCAVYVVSNRLRPLTGRRLLIDLFEAPVIRTRRAPGKPGRAPLKRAIDIVVSGGALLVLSPVLLACALAVKLTSSGPVVYAQERLGLGCQPFRFYKFRSMQTGADPALHSEYVRALINGEAEARTQSVEGEDHEVFKLVDDPRITSAGRFLRRYSLDELPQLWNVFKGDMSLVGPRPPLPYEVTAYQPWHRRRLEVQPGITGVWQVEGRSRVSFDDMVLQDILYECSRNTLIDASLCLRTVPAALLGHGAA